MIYFCGKHGAPLSFRNDRPAFAGGTETIGLAFTGSGGGPLSLFR